MKKRFGPDYLLNNYFFYQFLNNFSALLCKINVLDIFDMGDVFQIFLISLSTAILIESNLRLEMYMLCVPIICWK